MIIVRGLVASLLICAAFIRPVQAAETLKIASFSTVLTEIAQQVGGTHVTVAGLVKPEQDPHEYQPTPADLEQTSSAKLILLSGKHLEDYLEKVQQATGGKAQALAVGDSLPTLKMKAEEDESQN